MTHNSYNCFTSYMPSCSVYKYMYLEHPILYHILQLRVVFPVNITPGKEEGLGVREGKL